LLSLKLAIFAFNIFKELFITISVVVPAIVISDPFDNAENGVYCKVNALELFGFLYIVNNLLFK
jgi:hypothetical protein